MKKLKLLPTILMLVLCVGVLAIGIYAIKPTENNISGSIAVNASNAEVKLELLENGVLTQTFESVRGGVTFKELNLEFNVENANELIDVDEVYYTIRITNKSTKPLGAYFFDPTSTLPADGYAVGENILNVSTINTNGSSPVKMADVVLGGYAYVPADTTKPVDLDITMTLSKFFDTTVAGDFEYTLNIEPYKQNLQGFDSNLSDNYYLSNQGQAHTESLLKLPYYGLDPEGVKCNITSIPSSFLSNNTNVKNFVVPSSYTSIDSSAFSGCTNLVSVEMQWANPTDAFFGECTALKNIGYISTDGMIKSSGGVLRVRSGYGNTISAKTCGFAIGTCIKKIVISEGITTIKNNAFESYYPNIIQGLSKIILPSTLSNVEPFAFYVAGEDIFFSTVANLSIKGEFSGTGWNFKDGSIAITGTTFSGLGDLQGLGALVVEDINVPTGVTAIGSNAFRAFANAKNIILPDGLLSIGSMAFDVCLDLNRIFIPKSVTTVGANIYGGYNITEFYCEATEKPSGWDSAWSTSGSGMTGGTEFTTSWGVARPDWADVY